MSNKSDGATMLVGCAVIIWWLILAFIAVCAAVIMAREAFGW